MKISAAVVTAVWANGRNWYVCNSCCPRGYIPYSFGDETKEQPFVVRARRFSDESEPEDLRPRLALGVNGPRGQLEPTDHGEWIVGLSRGKAYGLLHLSLSSFEFGIRQLSIGPHSLTFTAADALPIHRFGRMQVGHHLNLELAELDLDLVIRGSVVTDIELLSDQVPQLTYGADILFVWPDGERFMGMRSGSPGLASYQSRAAAIHGLIGEICRPSRYPTPLAKKARISAPEARLYEQLRAEWPGALSQQRLPFLGAMHVDVYLPELNVAIEYQGPGHTEPIYGAEQLVTQRARDARKRMLCDAAGVPLVEVFPGYDFNELRAEILGLATRRAKRRDA